MNTKASFRLCAGNDARVNHAAGIQAPLTRMVATPCYRAPEVRSFTPLSDWLCFPIRLLHQCHVHSLLVALLLDRLFSRARSAAALLAVPVLVRTSAGCHTLCTHAFS